MANIILAWEYERDDTHIARLLNLQKKLTEMGHQAYLIGSHLPLVDPSQKTLPFLSAPRINSPFIHKPRAMTKIGGFSDRLAQLGFGDFMSLQALLQGWDHLFALLKPQLLISDCAPAANLAAYNHIPCIQVSDGMSLPPAHLQDFPRLRPDAPPLIASAKVLQYVGHIQMQRKKNSPPTLPALLQSQFNFICHLPDLDPYAAFRAKDTVYGPYHPLPFHTITSERKHYFAYLDKNYPDFEEILIGLVKINKTGIFYIPGASDGLKQYLLAAGMQIHPHLPPIETLMGECAWVLHHGNTTVAQVALAAGVPQFTLPFHFESDWISMFLNEQKVGLSVNSEIHPITNTPEKIMVESQNFYLRQWAVLKADHIKQQHYPPLETIILDTCQSLLS